MARFRKLRFEETERGWVIRHSVKVVDLSSWRQLDLASWGQRGLGELPTETEFVVASGPPATVDAGKFIMEKLKEEME